MTTDFRVGQGEDRHRLETGENLVIGGVTIESDRGTVGHSDGDVLVHAIIDALLGAVALGDIGQHFPDDDPEWEDVRSVDLLRRTLDTVETRGWAPSNLDTTVLLQSVTLAPYRSAILDTLGETFPRQTTINVKFTTGEGVGPVGRGEAIDARAICLISRLDR